MVEKTKIRATLVLTLLLLTACAPSVGQESANDSSPNPPRLPLQKDLTGLALMPDATQDLGEVRIKVFPHTGEYTGPQGREYQFSEVSLSSAGNCQFQHPSSGAEIFKKTSPFQKIHFKVSDLQSPVVAECDHPIKVIRFNDADRDFSYRGRLILRKKIASDGAAFIEVVNLVHFEDYIRGVVPTEMPSDWHLEALRAQTIAARTYGYFEILKSRAEHTYEDFDIDDTVFYQAYEGTRKEDPRTDQAVTSTLNQVMTYEGRIIKAWFHSDAGGRTEDAKAIFGVDAPYCVGKVEPFDPALVPLDPWHRAVSFATLSNATGLPNARELIVTEKFGSGRVKRIEAFNAAHGVRGFSGQELEVMFSMRSNYFEVSHTSYGFLLTGKGFGHGVGMSQWGAQVLGEKKNWSAHDILNFYYTGIKICQIGHCS